MLDKNQTVTIKIEDISSSGEGIGKVNGYTLFVKDTIIGDLAEVKVIKAKKTYGYGKLMKIVKPSKDRVEPKCPVARSCGGCQIQEMSYEAQLRFKHNLVKNNLERIAGLKDIEVLPVIGMDEPYNYRNKAQFPVGLDKDGNIAMGFYAGRTHSIINNTECEIGSKLNAGILAIIREHMLTNNIKPYNEETNTGLIRHVLIRVGFVTKQVMVCVVINGDKIPQEAPLIEKLREVAGITSIMVNINKKNTNVILGDTVRTLWGQSYIEDYIGDVKFQISPLSFFQVNPVQTYKLYSKALEYAGLTGNETVWDLYCGIGTISLFLAKNAAKVYGVEVVPQAIEDAKNNAKINNIDNVEFLVGKSEEVLPEYYEKHTAKVDVVVVDPPRKGCDAALLDTIIKMAPKRMVYVSCDSATLARDLKILTDNGFAIEQVQPVDQFPHSVHVESVVLLTKVQK